ncbi:2-hydroxyacid dehydrogenase [Candidatus Uabimicrobium sp. HlEnr_7]|uniref:2-hydroxyacid dehydrogenase n=1 Tax=Candidatus Uabimicrobium helgolandensis TaxID=3095367 RepID=UPI003557711E
MKKILFYQNIGIDEVLILGLLKEYNVQYEPVFAEDENTFNKEDVEIIVVVNKKMSADTLQTFPNLKMISVSFTGFDSVDRDYCTQNNIAVYNAAGYSTDPVAELTIALAQAVLRQIPQSHGQMKLGDWQPYVGQELANKTIGIIGTGAIGMRVAELAKVYKCKVLGYSRSEKPDFQKFGNYVTWKEIFTLSDIISVHLPLNEKTKNSITKDEFTAMKNSSIIINTARGPVICRDSLIDALKNKTIYGAALDVYVSEPPRDEELQNLENVVLMPHIGFRTKEALLRKANITIANIDDFLTKREEENRVY